jgi:hypothetical protein
VAATTAAPSTAAATSAAPAITTQSASTGTPTTQAPATTSAPTTVDDASATVPPADVGACSLLGAADIEQVLGGPVGGPSDLETSCEWTVGEGSFGGNVMDTLTLTVEGPASGLADTRELLGPDGTDVPEAGDGGVYWADFTTLYFTKDGRELSLQFLAAEADDPLQGLVALANRVG